MPRVYMHDTIREHEVRKGQYVGSWIIGIGIIIAMYFLTAYFGLPPILSGIITLAVIIYLISNFLFRKRHKRKYRYN